MIPTTSRPTVYIPPTLFYFEHPDELKQYVRFSVVRSHTAAHGRSAPVWVVSGYKRGESRSILLAEFSASSPADTFRAMCEIVAKS